VLAQSCLFTKQYACASDEFRQILEQNPDSPAAHMLIGEALDGMGKTADAIVEFQAAASVAPGEPNLHFGLGYLHWKLHQDDDALEEFEKELAINPRHAQALAYRGDIEMKRNDPEKALASLELAVASNRDLRIAQLDMGAVLIQLQRYPEAMQALRQAVKLDPTQPDAHFRLGRLYQTTGNLTDAKKEFAEARRLYQKADDSLAPKLSTAPPPLE
jgi:tetratricopeptide (TPR) repeat protein